jgi:serine/threonine-protein kinase
MQVGQKVGPFDIEKKLGSGAMGTVFRARYRKTGQRVAIKVVSAGLGADDTALARFEREAEVLKQLNHRNIVRFYIASRFEESPYYAMEYIEGEPLDRVLHRRGRLTWEEVVENGRQICAALQHAHDQGIIHRDLKPSNLMVLPDGTVKLTDFGIAKDLDVTGITSANCTVGTAAYMSPEQCRGERNLTHKSDLYSLGVVLYELVTGRKPFLAETTMDMFLQHVQGAFERPSRIVLDIPVWLDNLICQLLEKKPDHRPYDASTVSQALNKVAEKVQALQSAGVDIAKARIADRARSDVRGMDETDREAARTLATGMRRTRRKVKKKPIYERAWLQAIGIVALLAALGAVIYKAFQLPPADQLYRQAAKLMQSDNPDDWNQARDRRTGPIDLYLYYYGQRQDEQTKQIRFWADEVDERQTERVLKTRYKLTAENEGESMARNALDYEEAGNLTDAEQGWRSLLAKYKDDENLDLRKWALVAATRLPDVTQAIHAGEVLHNRVKERWRTGSNIPSDSPAESLAEEAVRCEELGDLEGARSRWARLKGQYEHDRTVHSWVLLAIHEMQQLKARVPKEDEAIKSARIEAIAKELHAIEDLHTSLVPAARRRYQDLIALYKDDTDSKVRRLVKEAQNKLQQLRSEHPTTDRAPPTRP